MARVVSIYRYPVKGLSAEALPRVALEADPPLPFDRDFALARPTAPIDRDDPQWAKKGLFARSSRPRAVAGSSAGDAITFTTRRKGSPGRRDSQMPFEAVPADWRCPDCGAEKAIFRPYGEARRQA